MNPRSLVLLLSSRRPECGPIWAEDDIATRPGGAPTPIHLWVISNILHSFIIADSLSLVRSSRQPGDFDPLLAGMRGSTKLCPSDTLPHPGLVRRRVECAETPGPWYLYRPLWSVHTLTGNIHIYRALLRIAQIQNVRDTTR